MFRSKKKSQNFYLKDKESSINIRKEKAKCDLSPTGAHYFMLNDRGKGFCKHCEADYSLLYPLPADLSFAYNDWSLDLIARDMVEEPIMIDLSPEEE